MRGRLIQRFVARIYRLDRAAMRGVDPDLAGSQTSGYDDDFREPVLEDQCGEAIGSPRLRYMRTADLLSVQIVGRATHEALRMLASGDSPEATIDLVTHRKYLESGDLLDDDQRAVFAPGDKLDAILTTAGVEVLKIADPPGAYLIESSPRGWGLNIAAPTLNLWLLRFADRQVAPRRTT